MRLVRVGVIPTYPGGPLIYGFWTVVCLPVALWFGGFGLGGMFDLVKVPASAASAFMVVGEALLVALVVLLCGRYNLLKLQRRL